MSIQCKYVNPCFQTPSLSEQHLTRDYQFAPTEDLARYPRDLEADLEILRPLLHSNSKPANRSVRGLGVSENESFRPTSHSPSPLRGLGISEHESFRPSAPSVEPSLGDSVSGTSPLIVFAPGLEVMYPLKGELQDLGRHKGVNVDVRGWGDVMEGLSRRALAVTLWYGLDQSSCGWMCRSAVLRRCGNRVRQALQRG